MTALETKKVYHILVAKRLDAYAKFDQELYLSLVDKIQTLQAYAKLKGFSVHGL